MKKEYIEFLKKKIKLSEEFGFDIEREEINPLLFEHQKDIVKWAIAGGRRAVFASFGMGKTMMQLEVARIISNKINKPFILGLPLAVRHEFYKDAEKLNIKVRYCKDQKEAEKAWRDGVSIIMSNYERIRDDKFEISFFGGCCLDEASVIRSMGTQTTQYILGEFKALKYRFVFTATPSPNAYHELLKYADFLGIMSISHALSRYFQRDSQKAHNSTLLPHREKDFWTWMGSWGAFITKPSDLGYSDKGYNMPEIKIKWHEVKVNNREQIIDENGNIEMFHKQAKGLSDVSKEKRISLNDRINKAESIIDSDNWLIWHHREDERKEIQSRLGNDCKSVWGSQNEEQREDYLIGFSDGNYRMLSTKPEIAGSGCNFQYFCNKAIFVGIDYKFNDFIQAVHRIYRFGQTKQVELHIIYTDGEHEVKKALEQKWERHNVLVKNMIEIIKDNGLNNLQTNIDKKRRFMVERQEKKGVNYVAINNDSVVELMDWEENTVDMICSSIPFSDLFEYADSYNDMGQSLGDEEFFKHMDFLTPNLLKVLKPGRIAAIHVKDVIKYSYQNGVGFPSLHRFSDRTADHFEKHGFWSLGRITVTTDVVQENNQTYRLGWSEKCKDGTKMGVGLPEYVLLFRKPPSDISNAYADTPVTHFKEEYTRARWQLDAHGFWKSNANRLLTDEELKRFDLGDTMKWWGMYDIENHYDYYQHIELCEKLDKEGKLPVSFMVLPPKSKNPSVWDDIQRIRTLNTEQSRKRMVKHVCPLQLDLIERLIERYTNKNETVLDPFGGIMSVPFQALKMNRKGIGIELNTDYWRDGLKHLTSVELKKQELTLF